MEQLLLCRNNITETAMWYEYTFWMPSGTRGVDDIGQILSGYTTHRRFHWEMRYAALDRVKTDNTSLMRRKSRSKRFLGDEHRHLCIIEHISQSLIWIRWIQRHIGTPSLPDAKNT